MPGQRADDAMRRLVRGQASGNQRGLPGQETAARAGASTPAQTSPETCKTISAAVGADQASESSSLNHAFLLKLFLL